MPLLNRIKIFHEDSVDELLYNRNENNAASLPKVGMVVRQSSSCLKQLVAWEPAMTGGLRPYDSDLLSWWESTHIGVFLVYFRKT